jgi:hypothetical protein
MKACKPVANAVVGANSTKSDRKKTIHRRTITGPDARRLAITRNWASAAGKSPAVGLCNEVKDLPANHRQKIQAGAHAGLSMAFRPRLKASVFLFRYRERKRRAELR